MAYKTIFVDLDNNFRARYDKKNDTTKIIVEDQGVEIELQYEEVEDFYYFIKKVKELTV
tara:strand:+ start:296 stop:472 length:177 start_codon:yes stop_codon:yes gene_type:complete